jgi:hypothetical protein
VNWWLFKESEEIKKNKPKYIEQAVFSIEIES